VPYDGERIPMKTRTSNVAKQVPLLTTKDAAEHLNIAEKTARALCASRRITAIRVCGQWRIEQAEIERFKQENLSPAV
jgi:excisionase family DNA binding protein